MICTHLKKDPKNGPHPQFLGLSHWGAHPTPAPGLGSSFFSLRGDSKVLCSALLSQHRLGRLRFLGSSGDSTGRKGLVGE